MQRSHQESMSRTQACNARAHTHTSLSEQFIENSTSCWILVFHNIPIKPTHFCGIPTAGKSSCTSRPAKKARLEGQLYWAVQIFAHTRAARVFGSCKELREFKPGQNWFNKLDWLTVVAVSLSFFLGEIWEGRLHRHLAVCMSQQTLYLALGEGQGTKHNQ